MTRSGESTNATLIRKIDSRLRGLPPFPVQSRLYITFQAGGESWERLSALPPNDEPKGVVVELRAAGVYEFDSPISSRFEKTVEVRPSLCYGLQNEPEQRRVTDRILASLQASDIFRSGNVQFKFTEEGG